MQCEIPHSALIRGLGAPCGVWVSAAVSSNSMCHSVLTELPREHAFPTHKVVSRAQVHGLFKKELGWGMLSGRTERPGRGWVQEKWDPDTRSLCICFRRSFYLHFRAILKSN